MPGPNFSRKQKQRPESRCFSVSRNSTRCVPSGTFLFVFPALPRSRAGRL